MDLGFKADRVRFILADPSIPANIGAAARANQDDGVPSALDIESPGEGLPA